MYGFRNSIYSVIIRSICEIRILKKSPSYRTTLRVSMRLISFVIPAGTQFHLADHDVFDAVDILAFIVDGHAGARGVVKM